MPRKATLSSMMLGLSLALLVPAAAGGQALASGKRVQVRAPDLDVQGTVLRVTDTSVVVLRAGAGDTLSLPMAKARIRVAAGRQPSPVARLLLGLGCAGVGAVVGKQMGGQDGMGTGAVMGALAGRGAALLVQADRWVRLPDPRYPTGARIRYRSPDCRGGRCVARVLGLRPDTFVLVRDGAGQVPERVPAYLVLRDLQVSRGFARSTGTGATIGLVAGYVAVGVPALMDAHGRDLDALGEAMSATLWGAAVGMGLGALIGYTDNRERWGPAPLPLVSAQPAQRSVRLAVTLRR